MITSVEENQVQFNAELLVVVQCHAALDEVTPLEQTENSSLPLRCCKGSTRWKRVLRLIATV